jgi:hypothetical protein
MGMVVIQSQPDVARKLLFKKSPEHAHFIPHASWPPSALIELGKGKDETEGSNGYYSRSQIGGGGLAPCQRGGKNTTRDSGSDPRGVIEEELQA